MREVWVSCGPYRGLEHVSVVGARSTVRRGSGPFEVGSAVVVSTGIGSG